MQLAIVFIVALASLANASEKVSLPLSTQKVLCNSDAELYQASGMMVNKLQECAADKNRKNPDGSKQGISSCAFSRMGYLNDDKTKINWNAITKSVGKKYNWVITKCKDTDYDTDGGFWDDVGDWFFGEDFDWASLDKALSGFWNCCQNKFVTEATKLTRNKLFACSYNK